MLVYQIGPQKALQASAADTLLWEQGTIPSGSQVKGVSFVMTGTAHDVDSISTIKFKKGGSDFISFANDLQLMAYCDALGKKTVATSVVRFSIPLQNVYGWPINSPFCAAPPNEALSIEIVTDGTGSGAGTITPIFWLDAEAPANSYPVLLSQQLAAGTPSNATFAVTTPGMLRGFILDETNVTALRLNYLGQDLWNFNSLAAMNEVQELWQGTTVTTNRFLFIPRPIPVVPGQTNLIVTASDVVGQVVPWIEVPYA